MVNLETSAARQRQAIDNVGSHERIGRIIFPPAPTAVTVLVTVESIQTALYLLRQIVRVANLRPRNVFQCLGHDNVREEAGHCLLSAAVRKAGQVIERAKERAGY